MSAREERELVDQLQINVNLFVLTPSDIRGINAKIVTHHLTIHPSAKPVVQRKQKVGEEKRATIDEELKNLSSARFITEIKYTTWLTNVVLLRKANKKWRMCVDFIDLNVAYPKDMYPSAEH